MLYKGSTKILKLELPEKDYNGKTVVQFLLYMTIH